jgi:hypothetical protein
VTTPSTQLLRQLGSGVRPTDAAPVGLRGPGAPGIEGASFGDLLKQAREGGLASKLPVEIAPGANVALSDEQLARLSLAADRAEAAGVKTALVNIDGQRLVLDVHARRVMGVAAPENGVYLGIDGVMDLGDLRPALSAPAQGSPGGAGTARPASPLRPPAGTPAQSPSVLNLLAGIAGG